MQLEMTKKQLEALVKLVFLGKVLAEPTEELEEISGSDEVEQYIYAKAKEAGLDYLIAYNTTQDKYVLRLDEAVNLDSCLDRCLCILGNRATLAEVER